MDDRELVNRMIDGNEEAWAECVQRHKNLLFHILRGFGLSKLDVEDCFQTVFLKLHDDNCRRLRNWRGEVFRHYLVKIARNVALDLIRIHRPEVPMDPADIEGEAADLRRLRARHRGNLTPESVVVREDLVRHARAEAPRVLLGRHELAVFLGWLDGKTRDEIAEEFGITANNVGVILRRAMIKIQESVNPQSPEDL